MRRTTYLMLSVPAIFILMIVRIAVYGGLGSSPSFASLLIATMIELVPWSFLVFIGAKRLHDCNYKAWWIVMPFVVIAMWFWRPTQGANRFGADPRDDYFDDEIEIEKDNSIWIGVAILLFYNLVLFPKIIDEQQKYENRQNNTPTYQDNQTSNTQIPNVSPNDIVTPNINNEPQLNPQLVLAEAQKNYNNAVSNINEVWNSLHPSTQDFLRAEQRAINKKREADCTAYGNAQSADKDLAKAYRYLCEVPQLNERAQYLKTQLNTVITPPAPKNVGPAYRQNQHHQQNMGVFIHSNINQHYGKVLSVRGKIEYGCGSSNGTYCYILSTANNQYYILDYGINLEVSTTDFLNNLVESESCVIVQGSLSNEKVGIFEKFNSYEAIEVNFC